MAGLILLLGSMTALGAVSNDIYLPSLPTIARDLATTDALVKDTIALTMLGGAVGQLVIGALSDLVGRRVPVLVGVGLHILASVAIVFTPNVGVLLAMRFIQGVGNAAAQVIALAVIRDLYTGSKAARLMSQLMLIVGAAPLFAPAIGSWLAHQWTWHANFIFLAAVGLVLEIFMAFKLADTLDPRLRGEVRFGPVFRGYWSLLRDRPFMAFAVVPGLAGSVMSVWIVSAPFLLLEDYRLSAAQFPIVFAAGGLCMVIGAQVNAHVVRLRSPAILLRVALPIALGLAVVALGVSLGHWGGLMALLVPLFGILFVNGMGPANASALAMSMHGEVAGSAAALIGAIQTATGATVTIIVGAVGGGQVGMAATILVVVVLAQVILAGGTGIYRGRFPQPGH
jgi:DHA1 family bicyclomycin/chloramphenicol resistance-like MFS transporter